MSHNRQRARAARAARAAGATQATAVVVPLDLTAELPVYGALLVDQPLPDPDEFVIPDFVPWDNLIPRTAVGTVTAEHLVVRPVEDTAYTVQDAATLLDLLAGNTQQIPATPGPLLGLPQNTARWQ